MTLAEALLHLKLDGWCVLQEVIPPDNVEEVRRRVEIAVENHGRFDGVRGMGTCKGLIAFEQSFSPYLADPRLLAIVEALLGPHYRISFTSAQINHPGNARGPWHADWPFNQSTPPSSLRESAAAPWSVALPSTVVLPLTNNTPLVQCKSPLTVKMKREAGPLSTPPLANLKSLMAIS